MAYVLGLRRLGHDVYLFAEIDSERCYDSNYERVSFENWPGRAQFEELTGIYGAWPKCCLIYNHGEETLGLSFTEAVRVARSSDLLVNINGRFRTAGILEAVETKAYVDLDPAKTQIYHDQYKIDQGIELHDVLFSCGFNLGREQCEIPTCGRTWHPSFPPVLLSQWRPRGGNECRRFTTVSGWSGKETFDFQGKFSGEKSDQWRKFIDLPKRASQELEIALNINPAYREDIQLLKENGWILTDPNRFQGIEDYRRFIATSRAEFSVANNRYVQLNTGWISDRTARYLASGKPALVQSTGIEDSLPTGKGFLTFKTMDEALDGIERINKDYSDHCRAARELALEFFDSDTVLSNMLGLVPAQ